MYKFFWRTVYIYIYTHTHTHTHTHTQLISRSGIENYFLSVLTDPSTRQTLGLQQDPTSSSLGYITSSWCLKYVLEDGEMTWEEGMGQLHTLWPIRATELERDLAQQNSTYGRCYPDRLGPWGKFVENSAKISCPHIADHVQHSVMASRTSNQAWSKGLGPGTYGR